MFRLSLGRLRTPPLAATILLVVIGRVYTARAQDEGVPVVPKDSPLIQTAKQQMIFDELRHERAERREAARGARKRATVRHGRKGAKAGEARDEDIAAGRLVTGARGGRGATPLGVKGTAVVPTNVELNDKTGDGVTAGQAEERSVIVGRFGIGAWLIGCALTLQLGAAWLSRRSRPKTCSCKHPTVENNNRLLAVVSL